MPQIDHFTEEYKINQIDHCTNFADYILIMTDLPIRNLCGFFRGFLYLFLGYGFR